MSGTGAAIGAATGATYALATGKDPIKYAMIGGAVGGAGPGALAAMGGTGAAAAGTGAAAAGTGAAGTYTGLGMAGTGAAGTTSALTGTGAAGTTSALTGTGASTAANTAFMAPGGVNAGANALMGASQSAPTLATTTPGIFAPPAGGYESLTAGMPQPLTYEQATATGMQRPIGTFESLLNPNIESSSMAPSFMEQLGSGAGQVGQFAQQNPVLTQMAMQTGQGLLQQPQRRSQPPGLLRGTQMQASAPRYQVGAPQVSLI